MSNSNPLPKDIPSMEHTFYLDLEGDTTKKRWRGEFIYKIPNLRMKAATDKMRAGMNGGFDATLDISTLQFHEMIAYLKFTLVEVPTWWKEADWGYDLYDYNVVKTVFNTAADFYDEWIEKIWGKDLKDEKRTETKPKEESTKSETQ